MNEDDNGNIVWEYSKSGAIVPTDAVQIVIGTNASIQTFYGHTQQELEETIEAEKKAYAERSGMSPDDYELITR